MGSEKKKEARERFLLERFLECQGISPASIKKLDPPEPDFSIKVDGRKIGVELTEIFGKNPKLSDRLYGMDVEQAIESRSDKIVSRAREAYFQRSNPLVLATIVFSNLNAIRKKEQVEKIVKLLMLEVEDMAAETVETVDRRPDDFSDVGKQLCESVALIHIHKVPELRFTDWKVPKVGLVRKLTTNHLQDRITVKEAKKNRYTEARDEVWLLMVADGTSASQKFSYPLDFSSEAISKSSHFSRMFYFYYCYGVDCPVVEF